MAIWSEEELRRFGEGDEIRICSRRSDGSLTRPVIIWVVHHGDHLYVRSVYGRTAAWFRAAGVRHKGRILSGRAERDVAFEEVEAEASLQDDLDAAYRAKYHRYAASIVDSIVSPRARSAALRLVPSQAGS